MDTDRVLPEMREETVEDFEAKIATWPEFKDDAKPLNVNEFDEKNVSNNVEPDRFSYDDITYPAHYAGNNIITCKDAMASMMYGLEGIITPKVGYWLGCAFKYLWRAFLKGDPEKDLKKCKQCIDEMLNLM